MSDKLQVTIVGLGMIGASAGLALRRYAQKVTIVGHDKDPAKASQAKSLGAVDRTEWNLIKAVSDADRVLLALPVSEIQDTLAAIADDLKSNCVIVDTADVKSQVMQWAAELLPENVHMIGGHPIVVTDKLETAEAQADLFKDRLFCLTPAPHTDARAVQLAADLAEAMGAKPFFLGVVEHDGLVAAVEHVPQVLASALMQATSSGNSWKDMRKLAGSQFYSSTLVTAEDGRAVADACLANSEQIIRWLDTLIDALGEWRQCLVDGDDEGLIEMIERGMEANREWMRAYTTGNWEEASLPAEMPTSGTFMRGLIGFGRLRKADSKKKR